MNSAPSAGYCVIGNPIAQSRSPEIHARFAEQLGESIEYTRRLAPVDGFAASVRAFFADGGQGMNVTAPFKVEAAALADSASLRVVRAGAANCLRMRNGRLEAENFDGVGLVRDLTHNLGVKLAGCRVLMLGAGGAARGVIEPLLEAGVRELVIANRTRERAEALAQVFSSVANQPTTLRGVALADIVQSASTSDLAFDVVIDATSAALQDDAMALPPQVFAPNGLAYAMAYGKGLTSFLASAASAGARVADGLGMLVEQAAESYAWWRGSRPETGAVLAELAATLPSLTRPSA
ncbi:MAG: shikimate dehydrogenase [Casimicrobiaceae bacterium]